MDKQDFAQIKRQQEASEAPAGSQDYSGAMRFRWGGLAQERPLPPFGAMSMHMARKFNRKLLDERCPLGNEKPVRRLSLAASTAMLRPGSAAAARRGAHSPKKKNKKKKKSRGLSSDEAFHRATSSLLDRYVEIRQQRRRAVLAKRTRATVARALAGAGYADKESVQRSARAEVARSTQRLRTWSLLDEYRVALREQRARQQAEAKAAAAAAALTRQQLAAHAARNKRPQSAASMRRRGRRSRNATPRSTTSHAHLGNTTPVLGMAVETQSLATPQGAGRGGAGGVAASAMKPSASCVTVLQPHRSDTPPILLPRSESSKSQLRERDQRDVEAAATSVAASASQLAATRSIKRSDTPTKSLTWSDEQQQPRQQPQKKQQNSSGHGAMRPETEVSSGGGGSLFVRMPSRVQADSPSLSDAADSPAPPPTLVGSTGEAAAMLATPGRGGGGGGGATSVWRRSAAGSPASQGSPVQARGRSSPVPDGPRQGAGDSPAHATRPPSAFGGRSVRPGTAPVAKHGKAGTGWSPLEAYVQAKHPIAAYDAKGLTPFPTPTSQLRNAPCFSFGERPVPKRAFDTSPGPNHYSNVCAALDKLSKAHNSPSFSIRGKLPGYMDNLCQSGPGANIGLSHHDPASRRGFTFGVRHRHLDPKVNPTDPSAASYNPKYASPFDPEKLRRDRERTRKHPKLGIRLKSRRSIDAAIGTPIAPGPGTYILPSDFGQPPQIDLQIENLYEGGHRPPRHRRPQSRRHPENPQQPQT